MAKPPPPIPPLPASASTTRKLSYNTLRALWINAGGDPNLASTMAAIALAESGGTISNVSPKNTDGTIDQGLWQINSSHGYNAAKLTSDPAYNARAAVSIYNSQGPTAWTTFNNGAYQAFFVPKTPAERVANAAALQAAKLQSPAYVSSATNLSVVKSQALAAAKAQAHVSDPWITVTRDKNGDITGFGQPATGESPPPNVLYIAGQPATNSMYQLQWSSTYGSIYEAYTGKPADAAVQAQILANPVSTYTLMQNLASQPGFTSSPIYKTQASAIADQAQQTLGKAAPANFVQQAIVNSWDSTQVAAELKKLPGYEAGPVFQQQFDQAKDVYAGIYGDAPDPLGEDWLRGAVKNGFSQDEIAQTLRADPAYTSSPEFASKAYTLLQSLGLPTTAPAQMPPLPTPTVAPAAQLGVAFAPPLKTTPLPPLTGPGAAPSTPVTPPAPGAPATRVAA